MLKEIEEIQAYRELVELAETVDDESEVATAIACYKTAGLISHEMVQSLSETFYTCNPQQHVA